MLELPALPLGLQKLRFFLLRNDVERARAHLLVAFFNKVTAY